MEIRILNNPKINLILHDGTIRFVIASPSNFLTKTEKKQ